MTHLCFVSLNSFNLFSESKHLRHIGGGEVQQFIVARALAEKNIKVSFITLDHGQSSNYFSDSVRIFKCFKPTEGFRYFRFLHPRLTKLISALKRADADVYYQRGAEWYTAITCAYCNLFGKKFVFSIGSDAQCELSLPLINSNIERNMYIYGLRRAHMVIVQTNYQKEMLRQNFGIKASIIRNCGIDRLKTACIKSGRKKYERLHRALWIGRFSERKRLSMLLDIAKKCPEIHFDVIGNSNFEDKNSKITIYKGRVPDNVKFNGYVPFKKIADFYQKSHVLISTSIQEGFPNVFVEAWSFGLPVVSTVDPDGIIRKHRIGSFQKDVDGMAKALQNILNNESKLKEFSDRSRAYFLRNHTEKNIVGLYIKLINNLYQ